LNVTNQLRPFAGARDRFLATIPRRWHRRFVPLAKVKEMKRSGCTAFRGSRVHLGKLAKALVTTENELTTSEVLTTILEQVARIITGKNITQRDAFRLTSAVQLGFGVAVLILEPAEVDEFLRQTAKLCERIVRGPLRKAATKR
jgi:hypothetical protein